MKKHINSLARDQLTFLAQVRTDRNWLNNNTAAVCATVAVDYSAEPSTPTNANAYFRFSALE